MDTEIDRESSYGGKGFAHREGFFNEQARAQDAHRSERLDSRGAVVYEHVPELLQVLKHHASMRVDGLHRGAVGGQADTGAVKDVRDA
jgi:hypothetical protein